MYPFLFYILKSLITSRNVFPDVIILIWSPWKKASQYFFNFSKNSDVIRSSITLKYMMFLAYVTSFLTPGWLYKLKDWGFSLLLLNQSPIECIIFGWNNSSALCNIFRRCKSFSVSIFPRAYTLYSVVWMISPTSYCYFSSFYASSSAFNSSKLFSLTFGTSDRDL